MYVPSNLTSVYIPFLQWAYLIDEYYLNRTVKFRVLCWYFYFSECLWTVAIISTCSERQNRTISFLFSPLLATPVNHRLIFPSLTSHSRWIWPTISLPTSLTMYSESPAPSGTILYLIGIASPSAFPNALWLFAILSFHTFILDDIHSKILTHVG